MSKLRLVLAQVNNVFTVIPTLVISKTRHRVAEVPATIVATGFDLRWMWFSAILIYTTVNLEPDTADESRSE